MSYELSMPCYEGPLDLLLDLIDKEKINICDISIVQVTNQYIERVEQLRKTMDMEHMTEFLDMAVRLLEIKSRYLLYLQRDSEEEEDPTHEIRRSLEIYKAYRNAALYLKDRIVPLERYYTRKPHEVYVDSYLDLSNITLSDLSASADLILERKNNIVTLVSEKTKSLEERIDEIRAYTRDKKTVNFSELLNRGDRDNHVVTFLGVLELARFRQVKTVQKKRFGEILIERLEEENEFEETLQHH